MTTQPDVASASVTRRPAAVRRKRWRLGCALLLLLARHAQAGPFADAVEAFRPGANAGFGMGKMPSVVLGPPHGAGLLQGSLDVLSLGHGGEIVLRFDPPLACDGPGADLIVFENAFHIGNENGPVFAELAFVAVSQDGTHFVEFPWDATTWRGLAGKTPVSSNPDNGIDPRDPARAGGDAFDLSDVGLPWIRYVRIRDAGDLVPDPGNRVPGADSAGFDLDAIAAVHPCNPVAQPTPSRTGAATITVAPSPSATPTPTPTPTSSPTPRGNSGWTPTPTSCPLLQELVRGLFGEQGAADWNNDGGLSVADLVQVLREGGCVAPASR